MIQSFDSMCFMNPAVPSAVDRVEGDFASRLVDLGIILFQPRYA
jgi:hypothetical protein